MTKIHSQNDVEYIRIQWRVYILGLLRLAFFGGLLVAVFALVKFGIKAETIPITLLVSLAVSAFFFLIFLLFTALPNYIFYSRMMKAGKQEFITENIRRYGIQQMAHQLWFIWPRELDEKYQRKDRRDTKGSEIREPIKPPEEARRQK